MNFIDDITDFIFLSDEPEDADIIFIPGGSFPEIAETAARVWKAKQITFILPSGKYSIKRGYFPGPLSKAEKYNKAYATEWAFLRDVLVSHGVDDTVILREDEATNTYQNSLFSRKITDEQQLDIQKAIICCKSFHARRCLMYYQMAYPKAQLLVCPTDTQGVTRYNWFHSEAGITKVMGELERCGSQFSGMLKSILTGDNRV